MAASCGSIRGHRSALLAAANVLHMSAVHIPVPTGAASFSSELPQCFDTRNGASPASSAEDYKGVSTAAFLSDANCAVHNNLGRKSVLRKETNTMRSPSRFCFAMRGLPAPHCISFQRSFSIFSAVTEDKQDTEEPVEENRKEQCSLPLPSDSNQSSLPSRSLPVNPDNAASYVLMSNIYADGDKWDEVKRINEMRIQARAWKKPGKAYIECKSRVHEFIVGDETHQESTFIYDKIKKMRRHMNNNGYVPNVELVLQNRSNYDPFKPK